MRLFSRQADEGADVRPTLLGVVTLMFLLLFFLLSTSSGQRLGVLDLRLASPGEAPPLPHSGLVKSVRVHLSKQAAHVEFEVASTDVSSSATTRELRALDVSGDEKGPEAGALLAALDSIHQIDPSQERAEVLPDPDVPGSVLLPVLDVLRGNPTAPLFPKLSVL